MEINRRQALAAAVALPLVASGFAVPEYSFEQLVRQRLEVLVKHIPNGPSIEWKEKTIKDIVEVRNEKYAILKKDAEELGLPFEEFQPQIDDYMLNKTDEFIQHCMRQVAKGESWT